jgi:hypothetical protein
MNTRWENDHTKGSKSNIPCCALLVRQMRAKFAWCMWTTWRASYVNFAGNICVTNAPDSRCHIRESDANVARHQCRARSAQQGMLLLSPSVAIIISLPSFHHCTCNIRQSKTKPLPQACAGRFEVGSAWPIYRLWSQFNTILRESLIENNLEILKFRIRLKCVDAGWASLFCIGTGLFHAGCLFNMPFQNAGAKNFSSNLVW